MFTSWTVRDAVKRLQANAGAKAHLFALRFGAVAVKTAAEAPQGRIEVAKGGGAVLLTLQRTTDSRLRSRYLARERKTSSV